MKERSFISCCLLFLLFSCSQSTKDQGIKEMIATKAKQEISFAGVNFLVEGGVVTLTGNAPTEKDKSEIEEKIKGVAGVKNVVNQLVVAPVVLDGNFSLKQSVDDILKKYPTVQAQVKDSIIALQGTIDSKKAQKLFKSIGQLKAKGVTNELVINSQ